MIKYKATKYGNFMYSLCDKGAKFLHKHHWLYYLLNCTWGIIMTVIGLIISLVMLICGQKPHKYHGTWYFETGYSWILDIINFIADIFIILFWGIIVLPIKSIIDLFKQMKDKDYQKKKIFIKDYLNLITNPEYWGGLETGMCFITEPDAGESLCYHELGHTYQNAILGPLFPILVGIPSAIRYWYRELKWALHKTANWKPYDSIWFENSATNIGMQIVKKVDSYKEINK